MESRAVSQGLVQRAYNRATQKVLEARGPFAQTSPIPSRAILKGTLQRSSFSSTRAETSSMCWRTWPSGGNQGAGLL